jgi:Flp pilus assembly pilin Flp
MFWFFQFVNREEGQATAEYALVVVAAAAVALALIIWASSTDALSSLFDAVLARVRSYV